MPLRVFISRDKGALDVGLTQASLHHSPCTCGAGLSLASGDHLSLQDASVYLSQ